MGVKRVIDSGQAIGLKVGAVGEESNVMKSDENKIISECCWQNQCGGI